jgi:ubiquitin-conjugating enzyme E2 H
MRNHEVTFPYLDELDYFEVKFWGPKDTPYEGGVWKVYVNLPRDYPSSPPEVGFINKVSLKFI